MENKIIITTVLAAAVFLTGAAVVQAQTNVRIQAEQRTEVRSDRQTEDTEEEQARQQEAESDDTRSNRATVRDEDSDDDGVETSRPATRANVRANSTTSVTREIDKSSPRLMEALSISEDSPLRNAGVEIGVRGDVCIEGEDCDDGDTEVRPARANVSIRVSGEQVRSWSAEQKETVRERLMAASEVNTANDFGLRVASAALDNENVVDISSDEDDTEVRYKTRLRLLGFIPTRATATTRATSDGEMTVDYPWYSFLAAKDDDTSTFSALAAELRAEHDMMISVEEEN